MNFEIENALRVQAILYNTDLESLRKAFSALVRAVENAIDQQKTVQVVYGDCSPIPILSQDTLEKWKEECTEHDAISVEYHYFGQNLGSAQGHNTLMNKAEGVFAQNGNGGLLCIMNPDVKLAGDALIFLIESLRRPQIGIVEARQLPIEHPKHYDEKTGETSWTSTATALTTTKIFWRVEGFDADTFFLYCDDVDFTWRIREIGLKALFQPASVVFHDKRLNIEGAWSASPAEIYYSAEAALLLTYKWSRSDLTEKYLAYFKSSSDPVLLKAAVEFDDRRQNNKLPMPRDLQHKVGEFINLNYAKHRF